MAHVSPAAGEQPLRNHHRHPSGSSKKKQHLARPARPSVLRRDTSKSHLPKLGQPARAHDRPEDDDPLAATFLQYCTTCEKQISVPSNTVLYCSEACRKRDGHKSSEYPLFQTDVSPISSPRRSRDLDSEYAANIIPPRSPTSYPSPFASHRTSLVNMSSDEDLHFGAREPTRNTSWTSLAAAGGHGRTRPSLSRLDSDSSVLLHQYCMSSSSSGATRGPLSRNAPSLSHTPTSTIGTSTSYTASPVAAGPPRALHARSFSRPASLHFSSRSIDLVTPITIEQQKAQASPSPISTAAASDVTIRDQMERLSVHRDLDILANGEEEASDDRFSYDKQPAHRLASPRLTSTGSLQRLLQLEDRRKPSRGI